MHRVFQKITLTVNQPEVHPPGVDTDAVKAAVKLRLDNTFLYLMQQAQYVLIQGAVYTYRVVGEAVNYVELNALAVKFTNHGTPARCTNIKG